MGDETNPAADPAGLEAGTLFFAPSSWVLSKAGTSAGVACQNKEVWPVGVLSLRSMRRNDFGFQAISDNLKSIEHCLI